MSEQAVGNIFNIPSHESQTFITEGQNLHNITVTSRMLSNHPILIPNRIPAFPGKTHATIDIFDPALPKAQSIIYSP